MPVSVYGFIEGFTNDSQDMHNQRLVHALPDSGANLIRELFSFVPQSRRHAYYGSHIHFAAGHKELYGLDSTWIVEFELLLSKLYWYSAELVVTWSRERYVWTSDYSAKAPDKGPNEILIRARYESGWPLKEIPWNS